MPKSSSRAPSQSRQRRSSGTLQTSRRRSPPNPPSFVDRPLVPLFSHCRSGRSERDTTRRWAQNRAHNFAASLGYRRNLLSGLAPRAGFEPATLRLTAGCSAVELPRNAAGRHAPRRCEARKRTPIVNRSAPSQQHPRGRGYDGGHTRPARRFIRSGTCAASISYRSASTSSRP